jgi:hypothetical protein
MLYCITSFVGYEALPNGMQTLLEQWHNRDSGAAATIRIQSNAFSISTNVCGMTDGKMREAADF